MKKLFSKLILMGLLLLPSCALLDETLEYPTNLVEYPLKAKKGAPGDICENFHESFSIIRGRKGESSYCIESPKIRKTVAQGKGAPEFNFDEEYYFVTFIGRDPKQDKAPLESVFTAENVDGIDVGHSFVVWMSVKRQDETSFEVTSFRPIGFGNTLDKKCSDYAPNLLVEGHFTEDGQYIDGTKVKSETSKGRFKCNDGRMTHMYQGVMSKLPFYKVTMNFYTGIRMYAEKMGYMRYEEGRNAYKIDLRDEANVQAARDFMHPDAMDSILMVHVTREQFDSSFELSNQFFKKHYVLLGQDCTTWFQLVADRLGLYTPPRFHAVWPFKYADRLIRLNVKEGE